VLPRGEVREEVFEEHAPVRADVGVPRHLEHRLVVNRVFQFTFDGIRQCVVVAAENGEQRLRRGAALNTPASRGGVRQDLTPGLTTANVVALARVGAVDNLQVQVRTHSVVGAEFIPA
jgi:hypothetical protein